MNLERVGYFVAGTNIDGDDSTMKVTDGGVFGVFVWSVLYSWTFGVFCCTQPFLIVGLVLSFVVLRFGCGIVELFSAGLCPDPPLFHHTLFLFRRNSNVIVKGARGLSCHTSNSPIYFSSGLFPHSFDHDSHCLCSYFLCSDGSLVVLSFYQTLGDPFYQLVALIPIKADDLVKVSVKSMSKS